MAQDETTICELLDAFTHALFTKDAAGAIAPLADDAVTFDLAPPLQLGPKGTHDPVRLESSQPGRVQSYPSPANAPS